AAGPEGDIELAVQFGELLGGLRWEQVAGAMRADVLRAGAHLLLVVGGAVAIEVAADHQPLERLAGPEGPKGESRRRRGRLEAAVDDAVRGHRRRTGRGEQ